MLRVTSESVRLAGQILQGMWADILRRRLRNCRSSLHSELMVKSEFMTALSNILTVLNNAEIETIDVLLDVARAANTIDLHTGICLLPHVARATPVDTEYGLTVKPPPGVTEAILRKSLRPFWRILLYSEDRIVLTTNVFNAVSRGDYLFLTTKYDKESVPVSGRLGFVPVRATSLMMEEFAEVSKLHELGSAVRHD